MAKIEWKDQTGRDLVKGGTAVEVDIGDVQIGVIEDIAPFGSPTLLSDGTSSFTQTEGRIRGTSERRVVLNALYFGSSPRRHEEVVYVSH